MQKTTIFLKPPDSECIRVIKHRYGLATASDAIRLALRVLAESSPLRLSAEDVQKTTVNAEPERGGAP